LIVQCSDGHVQSAIDVNWEGELEKWSMLCAMKFSMQAKNKLEMHVTKSGSS